MSRLALTGVGAASAARGIVITRLTRWPAGLIEVVISRTDFLQAKAYLQTPGPRRLFISCSGGLDLLHGLLTRERGRIAAVSLSPWLYDTVEVIADGQITWMSEPNLANVVADPLPTLTRPEAYAHLMNLPTARKPTLLEARRQSCG